MTNGWTTMRRLRLVLAGMMILGGGTARAQGTQDRNALEAELARAVRLRQEGKPGEALPIARRAAEAAEKLFGADSTETANYLIELAALHSDLGQYPKAEALYQRSLKIREAQLGKDHPDVAISLTNLSTVLEATGQTARAAAGTDRGRRISRRHIVRILPALAEADPADFLRHTDEGQWYAALSLGLRHPEDVKLAAQSAAWLVNGKGVVQQTLAQTSLLARDSQDPKLRPLRAELQQTRQELARLTLNSPAEGQGPQRQRRLDELSEREQRLAKQLRQAGGRSDEEWIDLDTLRKSLPTNAVLIALARFEMFNFQAIKDQPKWQPAQYAAWIIPSTGPVRVLELGPTDAIDADVQKVRQALQDAPKTIRLKGEADAETSVRQPLEALAKKLLHPLLPHLAKHKRWIISPDGNLWLIPWAALPLPDGTYAVAGHTIAYAISGRDLLDAAPVAVTRTAPLVLANPDFDLGLDQVARATRRLLREQEAPAETRGLSRALRLGNIKRLPGTASEATAITPKLQKYAGAAPRVLTDQDATVGVFQATRNPQVVVLSTHGYFLSDQESDSSESTRTRLEGSKPSGLRLENPLLRCGLLLAGCNNADQAKAGADNGVLTGLQIVGTDLRSTELVVLSACETGLGEVRNGEGIAGLRQAFQLAGAQSVMATLWQVPDQQSAQLMISFFDGLATQQDKAEALRNAQPALIKARREKIAAAHPFFWAAFTLTGR